MSDPMMRVAQLDYLDRQKPGTPIELLGAVAEAFRNGWAAAQNADRTRRKAVQIAATSEGERTWAYVIALCDDGTIFRMAIDETEQWRQFLPIPQPGEETS